MPKEIVVQKREARRDTERLALLLLETGSENGDDDVLDRAIEIAYREKRDVVFRIDGSGKLFTPELAYNLRYHRGIDIRDKDEVEEATEEKPQSEESKKLIKHVEEWLQDLPDLPH